MRTILDSLQGKTMIWVTHHLIGAEQMDELIFMENGKIAMQGSHEQLLAGEERYRRLIELDRPGWSDLQTVERASCLLPLPDSRNFLGKWK